MTPTTPWDELPHALLIREVAVVLRISINRAYELVDSGAIRSIRTTPNRRIVPKSAVARFLEQEPEPGGGGPPPG